MLTSIEERKIHLTLSSSRLNVMIERGEDHGFGGGKISPGNQSR